MRKAYKFKKRELVEKKFRHNNQIIAPELCIIDETGASLGVMPTHQALEMAIGRGYDLVEVSPTSQPPVAKFLNFGSFRYHQEKQIKKQKQLSRGLDMKNIRLSIKIGEHDKDTKANQAKKFLEKGHKVKLEIILRGRELGHLDLARETLREFQSLFKDETEIEQDASKQGNKVFMILAPRK